MRSPRAASADMKSRNAVTLRRTCGHEGPQCCHLGAQVRARTAAALQPALSPAVPLTSRLNRLISLATKSKIVRPPALAAVGVTGVLDSTKCPVPARELSLLLLPRAPAVCTHRGQTSTGRIGAWPGLPAGGRSHLSTSRDVTSGLTARRRRLCHE